MHTSTKEMYLPICNEGALKHRLTTSPKALVPPPAHLAHVIMALLQTQARKTHSGLPTTAVLLGQVHRELVNYLAVTPTKRAVQASVTVHHDKSVRSVGLQKFG